MIRPTEWNFPLLVHVLGAMILVGGLLTGVSALAFARGEARLLRLGYWSLLAVALPGYIVMRIGAQWIYSKEGWDDLPDEAVPAWLDIGFIVADVGGVLTLVALILGGIGDSPTPRRQGRRLAQGDDGHRAARAGRRPHRGLGDVRQAELEKRIPTKLALTAGGRLRRPGGQTRLCVRPEEEGGRWGKHGFPHPRTTTGPTPGSPRSAVRYKASARLAVHLALGIIELSPRLRKSNFQSAARYLSFSHSVTWTRYSSHSLRLSST